MRREIVLASIVVIGIAAVGEQTKFDITEELVRTAIAGELRVTESDVRDLEIAMASVARVPQPELFVAGQQRQPSGRRLFEIRCRSLQCLPFYASARVRSGSLSRTMAWRSREKPVLRANERAMLKFSTDDMRISIPVVCVRSGARGETITVRTADSKNQWRAVVSDGGREEKEMR